MTEQIGPTVKPLSKLGHYIVLALLLGLLNGLLIKHSSLDLAQISNIGNGFGEIGKAIIQLVKILATPLLFLSILNQVLKTEISLKSGGKMIGISLLNACIALSLGLLLSHWLEPGKYLTGLSAQTIGVETPKVQKAEAIQMSKWVWTFIPTSVVQPFNENLVIPLVILTLLFGIALRRIVQIESSLRPVFITLESFIELLLLASETVIHWVLTLVPLAVFSVVVKSVTEFGLQPLKGLAVYVGVGLLGCFLQVALTYQIWIGLISRIPLRKFWKEAKDPILYAMGANSSLATLPLTLRALGRLGISKRASTLGACVGTNLNNDGILLYEAMAALMIAQASGITLSFGQELLVAGSALIAAMGIAGIPEAGFISLAVVLSTAGLPLELLPLLLTVDWIIARARSVTNVLSDMVLSIAIE